MGILEQIDRAKGRERILAEAREKARRDDVARKAYVLEQVAKGPKEAMQMGLELGERAGLSRGRYEGIRQGLQRGEQRGLAKGERQMQLNTAQRMLRKGFSREQVHIATQLSLADIDKLN